MSSFVRASKFRHVFCEPTKIDQQYTNLRLSTGTTYHISTREITFSFISLTNYFFCHFDNTQPPVSKTTSKPTRTFLPWACRAAAGPSVYFPSPRQERSITTPPPTRATRALCSISSSVLSTTSSLPRDRRTPL